MTCSWNCAFEVNKTINSVCMYVYVLALFLNWGVEEFLGHASEPINTWKLQASFSFSSTT